VSHIIVVELVQNSSFGKLHSINCFKNYLNFAYFSKSKEKNSGKTLRLDIIMASNVGRQLSTIEQIYDDEYYRLKRNQLPYEIQRQSVSYDFIDL